MHKSSSDFVNSGVIFCTHNIRLSRASLKPSLDVGATRDRKSETRLTSPLELELVGFVTKALAWCSSPEVGGSRCGSRAPLGESGDRAGGPPVTLALAGEPFFHAVLSPFRFILLIQLNVSGYCKEQIKDPRL